MHKYPPDYNTTPITESEIHEQLKKLKNYKAPGPDNETTMMYNKILDIRTRRELLKLLNEWWKGETLPEGLRLQGLRQSSKKGMRKNRKLQANLAPEHDL